MQNEPVCLSRAVGVDSIDKQQQQGGPRIKHVTGLGRMMLAGFSAKRGLETALQTR